MLDRRYTGSKVLCRVILILMFIATFLFVSINLIYLVFLPLALTLLSWQRHRYYDWLFIVYYFIYAVSLVTSNDIGHSSRLGAFYLGVPAVCYVLFLFPELVDNGEEKTIKIMCLLGISIAFGTMLFIF